MGNPGEQSQLLIVTGMSGAGRSTAANALEDLGWYVVDNLPPQMLRPLLDLSALPVASNEMMKLAAVVDARGRNLFEDFPDVMRELRQRSNVRLLFLDASDDLLVRRFESVRRPHPLQGTGTLLDGIRAEREKLAVIREGADFIVDTTNFNIHQLATHVTELFTSDQDAKHVVTVMSFGFKYGMPPDADMVADMRFLPNPFWVDELRTFTGEDSQIQQYVASQQGFAPFVDAYTVAVGEVLDGYQRENKRNSTIAVGCTGGKHRSVATAIELASRLAQRPGVVVRVKHRDLGRE